MKPFMKIGSFLLAAVMLLTAVLVAGCTPISANKEWSYKTSDKELSIGVYSYSLYTAYQKAETYAKKVDGYKENSDSWLDLKITDDDGNKEVASKWIKEQAEKMCLSYLVLDQQIKSEKVDIDKNTIASADEQAKTYWDVGQYADYGYIMPMSKDLEPFGISLESFQYCSTEYSVKYQALFNKLYSKGGSKEVSDSDLAKYFTDNYVDYSYVSVNLYESTTDTAGKSANVALSKSKVQKYKDEFDQYSKSINGGTSYDDVIAKYKKANKLTSDPSTSNVETLDQSSLGAELKAEVKKLDSGKAATIKVGTDSSAVYYLVYKRDINKAVDEYTTDETKRSSVLASMKSDDFSKYIEDLAKKLKYDANTSVLDRYQPSMYFVKQETTAASGSSSSAVSQ